MRNVMMALTMAAVLAWSALAQTPSVGGWVATWTTALVERPAVLPPAPANAAPVTPPMITPNNQTLRQIVHTSIGGTRARVVFANTFGTAPLAVGGASIALRDKDAAVVPSSVRKLTVNGNPAFRIPAGALMVSDPIDLAIPARADLAIDIFVPGDLSTGQSPVTMHNGANQTSYVVDGNHVGEGAVSANTITRSWFLLARVEVAAPARTAAVAAFGDSITDGARSTPDTNSRWPDQLARRLPAGVAVMNVGIAGNRVLSEGNFNVGVNALARFDRDVLAQPGVTHVIVMEGINDIRNQGPVVFATAQDLMTAYRQMIDRAHARGLKIYGATLTPCEGDMLMTAAGEVKRKAVNEWIRTSGAFDGVIDFDAVVRDAAQPTKIKPEFDSGDHLHPNDAGYKAMADAVNLALFRPSGS
jgi:lysophospholipase L1-like esterase